MVAASSGDSDNRYFVLEKVSESIKSTATYQNNGNYLHTVTDSRGNTTTYAYDTARGLQTGVTDAEENSTTYVYNSLNDRLESVTGYDKDNAEVKSTVKYTYKNIGLLNSITSPSGTVYSFGYDDFGNTTRVTQGTVPCVTFSPQRWSPSAMALATKHLESKNWWNYRQLKTLDIVWEEILMRFIYTPNRTDIIVEHEIMMLKEYSKIISNYSDMFAQHGCSLNVGCVWNNLLKKNISNFRISFQNGYACYIYCDVLKDGNVLRYNTYDGEADYYEATVSWNISSIEKSFFHLTVTLHSEMDGIHNEIMQLLKVVEAL